MYLGLIKFRLDDGAFPDNSGVIAGELSRLSRKLQKNFRVQAVADYATLTLIVCVLKDSAIEVRKVFDRIPEYLEDAGAGRVDDSIGCIESVDVVLME